MSDSEYHPSILVKTILAFAEVACRSSPQPLGRVPADTDQDSNVWIFDGTLGDGGHGLAFLEAFSHARLLGFDQDPVMLARARKRLLEKGISVEQLEPDAPWKESSARAVLIQANFSKASGFLDRQGIRPCFMLLDLGVSMFHFRGARRGFSYEDASLDMRLSPEAEKSAREILSEFGQEDLYRIFRDYGEERFALRIARAIVRAREEGPIESASELAALVLRSVPRPDGRRVPTGRIHPATRVFQALRIEVNNELEALASALRELPFRLAPGGRLAVLSFHSLEDRMVKQAFRKIGTKPSASRSLRHMKQKSVSARIRDDAAFWIRTPKPIVPSSEEIAQNPASRSAKLRVLERSDIPG